MLTRPDTSASDAGRGSRANGAQGDVAQDAFRGRQAGAVAGRGPWQGPVVPSCDAVGVLLGIKRWLSIAWKSLWPAWNVSPLDARTMWLSA